MCVTQYVCRFWKSYTDLLDKKPVFVKSMTSLVGFALGDILAQVIGGQSYNLPRTLRMVLFGIIMDGPVGMIQEPPAGPDYSIYHHTMKRILKGL